MTFLVAQHQSLHHYLHYFLLVHAQMSTVLTYPQTLNEGCQPHARSTGLGCMHYDCA
jgi:hypothetical protein